MRTPGVFYNFPFIKTTNNPIKILMERIANNEADLNLKLEEQNS